jgi:hypothetical protein
LERRKDALGQRLQETIRRAEEEMSKLQIHIDSLREIKRDWPTNSSYEQSKEPTNGTPFTRVPIAESIDRFIAETGEQEFSASDIRMYLNDLGYSSKWLYNSIFENLTRRVKSGRLEKAGQKFKVKY